MISKIVKNKKGVTLLEMLVSIAIFSVVVLSATEIFKLVIVGQRDAIASQNLQESMRYTFETMAKEIRMAKISNNDCASEFGLPAAVNKVYNLSSNVDGDILYFKNKDDICVAYYLEGDILKVRRGDDVAPTTPAKIKVNQLEFTVADDLIGAYHSTQPSATMKMDVEVIGREVNMPVTRIQTTISSRYYE